MRFTKAPGWRFPGDSVDGVWKENLLISLGKLYNLDYMIETGTSTGSTSKACAPHFKLITTIELSEKYYNEAKDLLRRCHNVDCVLGDSAVELERILKHSPKRPHLVWLDAHPSAPDSANAGDVLPREIELITKYSPDSFVVIDDMPDAELKHVQDAGVDLSGWVRTYVSGEILMHRGGYEFPEFE